MDPLSVLTSASIIWCVMAQTVQSVFIEENGTHFWVCIDRTRYGGRPTVDIYPHPTDCHRYVVCAKGYPRLQSCPLGRYYSHKTKECVWPAQGDIQRCETGVHKYTKRLCSSAETVKVPLPDSCGLYIDCASPSPDKKYYNYIMECPYPKLYSSARGECLPYKMVECGARPEPVAPCDYLQYKQLCNTPYTCSRCEKRHPSCRHHADGMHPIHHNRRLFKVCYDQRTQDVRSCNNNFIYNPRFRKCFHRSAVLFS